MNYRLWIQQYNGAWREGKTYRLRLVASVVAIVTRRWLQRAVWVLPSDLIPAGNGNRSL